MHGIFAPYHSYDLNLGANNAVIKYFTEPLSIWIYLGIIQLLFLVVFGIVLPSGSGDKKAFLICLASIAAIWLLVVVTRIGLNPDDRYWNVAGVPVLLNQLVLIIFLVLIGDLIFDKLKARNTDKRMPGVWLDVVICLLLWIGLLGCGIRHHFRIAFSPRVLIRLTRIITPIVTLRSLILGGSICSSEVTAGIPILY